MIRCLDIHTHNPAPQPLGVIAASMEGFHPMPDQLYSLGVHPWVTQVNIADFDWKNFEQLASAPQIVAIGECGIDKLKGGLLFKQMIVFKNQIDISERLAKPLIIHDVKAHDVIYGLKKDLNPKQNWLIHGFRGKPSLAKMFTDAGVYLSFGEKFNAETLISMPQEFILAETDESLQPIEIIIANISLALGYDATELIAENTQRFLYGIN